MKRLYCLLLQFSLTEPLDLSRNEAFFTELNKEISWSGFEDGFKDLRGLADFLFKQLDTRFKSVFDDLCGISFGRSPEFSRKDTDLWDTIKEFMLLLRSCLVILTLVGYEQNMILEKGGLLLSVLRNLIYLITSGKEGKDSISLEKSFSHEYRINESDFTTLVSEDFFASLSILEPSDPCHPFVCAVLEVFVDELLMHRSLREYFMLVDSASSTTKMLFMHNLVQGGIETVLEVLSTHFILSVSDEQAFHNFLNKLCWAHFEDLRVPEVSLTAALSLLLNPVMLSAPKMLQAHFISLVSEVIGINVFLKSPNWDHRLMDLYLIGFERAVMLYNRHMCNLHVEGAPSNPNGSFINSSNCSQPFESYIQRVRREKIDNLVSKYEDTCLFSREKCDLQALSISYVVENQHILDESCKDSMLSILHYIILRASQVDGNEAEIYKTGYTSHDDIYLLASILKLMSSSFLPAIWCLRHCRGSGGHKILKEVSSFKEYGFILNIISCFQEFDFSLPNQNLMCKVMKTHPTRHKDSKWMFLHFTGLLTLSFSSGFDFLVKDCVLAIMTALNLLVFEEGDLDALSSLVDSEKVEENSLHLKSSETVARKFQRIQTLHVSSDPLTSFHKEVYDDSGQLVETARVHNSSKGCTIGLEGMEETCSGEIFIKCLLKDYGNASSSYADDVDDDGIADFVEFKRGKDYLQWIKNRQRYRKWKSQKLAVLRWKKKKKTWRYIKGKKK